MKICKLIENQLFSENQACGGIVSSGRQYMSDKFLKRQRIWIHICCQINERIIYIKTFYLLQNYECEREANCNKIRYQCFLIHYNISKGD